MSRQSRPSRARGAGFSFVELLVTIVIAGIAFSALVPVFVSAQQKGIADQTRSSALSLARDKLEKIRQLDYDQINETNLNSASFYNNGFGHYVSLSYGNGVTKTYTVDYTVTFVGGAYDGQRVTSVSSGNKSERYKQVSVAVYWTGNPQPVKKVVLSTSVNKQYQGSRIDALVVENQSGGTDKYGPYYQQIYGTQPDATRQFVTALPVTFSAYVNDADAVRTSKVTFLVYNYSALAATLVCNAADSVNGKYQVSWNPGGVAGSLDGTYTVKATATNINGYGANTVTTTFTLETGPPPSVTGAVATGYDTAIGLAWSNTSAGDVLRYQVVRMTGPTPTSSAPVYAWDPSNPTYTVPFVQGSTPSVVDADLPAKGFPNNDPYTYPGDPTYTVYFEIIAVDSVGKTSGPTIAGAIPHKPRDWVPPTTPTNFAGTVTTSSAPPLWIRLTWGFSTDPPTPSPDPTTGVYMYRIYRAVGSGTFSLFATVLHNDNTTLYPTYTWTDSALKPLTAYRYYVTAIDRAYNESTATATYTATTPNYAYNYVRLQNVSTSSGYNVTVTNTDGTAVDSWPWPTGSWTTTPITGSLPKKPDTRDHIFAYLPVGFSFKINYQSTKNGVQPWLSKDFIVTSTTQVTVGGVLNTQVDIP